MIIKEATRITIISGKDTIGEAKPVYRVEIDFTPGPDTESHIAAAAKAERIGEFFQTYGSDVFLNAVEQKGRWGDARLALALERENERLKAVLRGIREHLIRAGD